MYTKVCLKMMVLSVITVVLAWTVGAPAWAEQRSGERSSRFEEREDLRDHLGKRRIAALLDLTARNGEAATSTFGLKQALSDRYSFENILSSDHRMAKVFEVIDAVAATRTTVLITGESGTGKELMARFIHWPLALTAREFSAHPDFLKEHRHSSRCGTPTN